jgi:hypothetical protein
MKAHSIMIREITKQLEDKYKFTCVTVEYLRDEDGLFLTLKKIC